MQTVLQQMKDTHPYYKYDPFEPADASNSPPKVSTMKVISYVRFTPEAAEAYKSIALFNPACVYPVIGMNDDDVIVELHPKCMLDGNSSKLVVPRNFVAKIAVTAMEFFPVGTELKMSPQFVEAGDIAGIWNKAWPRTKDTTVVVQIKGDETKWHPMIVTVATNDTGDKTCMVHAPTHWFVPCAPTPEEPDEEVTGADGVKRKVRHPKNTDINKMVRYISGPRTGEVHTILTFNKFRATFGLYDSLKETTARKKELELVDAKEVMLPIGCIVTQSEIMLKRGHGQMGATHEAFDTKPAVLIVIRHESYGRMCVSVLTQDETPAFEFLCCAADVRRLTEAEQAAMKDRKKTAGRDEAWCRKVVQPIIVKMIDTCPHSPFISGIIHSTLGIIIPGEFKTKEEVWAAIVAEAPKIKETKKKGTFLYFADFMPKPEAAPATPTPDPTPVEAAPEVRPEVPANVPVAVAAIDPDGDAEDEGENDDIVLD